MQSYTRAYLKTKDAPQYASSFDVGAVETWEAGYDGNGMIIAVIDTGLDMAPPPSPQLPRSLR